MRKKYPYFTCSLPIASEEDIYGVANIISEKLVGGITFGGLEDYIYEEVPTVYINKSILGLEFVIQGYGGEKGYIVEVHSHPGNDEPDNVNEVEIDITCYVASLLEGTEKIKIKYEQIAEQDYIIITE
ncbi:hypothetical protein HPY28_16830 [Brevibacillus sp. HB1.2]|uniref:hypothetical protein n=1 Tax=unclassified Brevibacillus TaxID=2684853 RepID=UPI001576DB5C|nr:MULTISPECIES: hypothetical protein [unclassified Brevibacillus]NTU21992.1 hypothetical protein [Brevibacillus sp. HB1.2]NTU33110.1 hypothetical protein [Brevibacillus sp. HB1.1]